MTAGQVSDYIGAAALLDSLPAAQRMLGDRGYGADWFRDALEQKGIKPCILGRKSHGKLVRYDRRKYNRRNRIEIIFGRPRTGGELQPATTDARSSSFQPSASPQLSCFGYESLA